MTIISGGQTGSDRAALDVAITLGIPHGGWCPKDRKAEDGPISNQYQLQESSFSSYSVRTELNVRKADATVVFISPASYGSKLTCDLAVKYHKALLMIHFAPGLVESGLHVESQAKRLRSFLEVVKPTILNVAGTRESKAPGIWKFTYDTLKLALSMARGQSSTTEKPLHRSPL